MSFSVFPSPIAVELLDPAVETLLAQAAVLSETLGGEQSSSSLERADTAARGLFSAAHGVVPELGELAEALQTCVARLPQASRPQAMLSRSVLANAVAYIESVTRAGAARAGALKASTEERAALLAAVRAASAAFGPRVSLEPEPEPRSSRAENGSLIELFRTECEEHSGHLSDGLVALEALGPSEHAARDARLRELMRAAHSLKGAARVAGLGALSSLAHNLEDRLIAWSDTGSFEASEVDLLLSCVDLFRDAAASLGADGDDNAPEIEAAADVLVERLGRPRAASLAPARDTARPGLALVQAGERAAHAAMLEPAAQTSVELRAPASLPPSARVEKRVLRVATENLDRLTGLAGESLVESRRVGSLAQGAVRARKRQNKLTDLLLACQDAGRNCLDESTRELLAGAITESGACGAVLGEHAASLDRHVQRIEVLGERLYRESLQSRMRPFADGARGLGRVVRDLARKLDKKVRFELEGQDAKVDREILEGLDAPLNHLLRNAIDHGIEAPAERRAHGKPEVAVLRVRARHQAGALVIVVSDDGRGINVNAVRRRVLERKLAREDIVAGLTTRELFDFLFLPAFSTATTVSEISGRGVGLDVVKSSVEALGGSVHIESEEGRGASFQLRLPVTRSVVRAVSARIGDEMYAFPLHRIDRIDRIELSALTATEGTPCFLFDGQPVSVVSARTLLGLPLTASASQAIAVVMVSDRSQRFAIAVDALCGEQDLVVRPLDARLGKVQDIAAAAILEDGTPALIVDIDDLLRSVERATAPGSVIEATLEPARAKRKRVLVVDDSITVRESERQLLLHRGYEVDLAVDGVDGLNALRRKPYDLVVTDIDMPRLNGFELIRSIRKDGKLAALPVVIVSYKDREEDRRLGLEVGASYYLTKASFHDERLLEAVQDLIGEAM
jgi:two-component system sensor histidine kinase and response regulator WspE